ncbi:hypothetical protein EMIT0P74_40281 [Pseudomonas sp. IT-P74]
MRRCSSRSTNPSSSGLRFCRSMVLSLELSCTGTTGGISGRWRIGSVCEVIGTALKGSIGGSMFSVSCQQAVGCGDGDLSHRSQTVTHLALISAPGGASFTGGLTYDCEFF